MIKWCLRAYRDTWIPVWANCWRPMSDAVSNCGRGGPLVRIGWCYFLSRRKPSLKCESGCTSHFKQFQSLLKKAALEPSLGQYSWITGCNRQQPSNRQAPLSVIDELDLPLPCLRTEVCNMPSWLLFFGKRPNGQRFIYNHANMLLIVFHVCSKMSS